MQKMLADVTTWPSDPPQLIGSRCDDCGATTFPVETRCPRCGHQAMSELPLPRRGTLVAWTTQGFPPVVPYAGDETGAYFEPFGVGLVQLDDVVRVECRLTESDPAKLEFGMDGRADDHPLLHRRRRQRDRDLRLRTRHRRPELRSRDMTDVAIIGVGLHPFGRFGDKTAIEMGADAVDLALTDAGVGLEGHPVRLRRQLGGRPDRPAHRSGRPHRHPVHERVQRLRHRGASAIQQTANAIRPATTTSASPSAWTSTRAARSRSTPPWRTCRSGTPRTASSSPPSSSA